MKMPEPSLRRRPGRDLPSFGSGSASLLAFGPADRIGPLPQSGLRTARGRVALPVALLACALLAAAGTAVVLHPRREASPPTLPERIVVAPIPPAVVPSMQPPREVAVEAPPPAVVATYPAAPPSDPSTPLVKSIDRVAPAAPSAVRPRNADDHASHPEVSRTEREAPSPPRTGRHPAASRPGPAARTTLRHPAPTSDAEVRETGATPRVKPVRPVPSPSGPASSWSLPSVLRPGGF